MIKPVLPHNATPDPREIDDRVRLADEVNTALEKLRKTAENWKTGVAGLVTLTTATLLFKGQASIASYDPYVQYALGLFGVGSVCLAIAALWYFLFAAYGRTETVSAQSVIDAGGVDIRNIGLTKIALDDLSRARHLSLGSAGCLIAAIALSWYGPTEPGTPLAFAKIVIHAANPAQPDETLCGEQTAQNGATTVLKIKGEPEPRKLTTAQLVSWELIPSCRPKRAD